MVSVFKMDVYVGFKIIPLRKHISVINSNGSEASQVFCGVPQEGSQLFIYINDLTDGLLMTHVYYVYFVNVLTVLLKKQPYG